MTLRFFFLLHPHPLKRIFQLYKAYQQQDAEIEAVSTIQFTSFLCLTQFFCVQQKHIPQGFEDESEERRIEIRTVISIEHMRTTLACFSSIRRIRSASIRRAFFKISRRLWSLSNSSSLFYIKIEEVNKHPNKQKDKIWKERELIGGGGGIRGENIKKGNKQYENAIKSIDPTIRENKRHQDSLMHLGHHGNLCFIRSSPYNRNSLEIFWNPTVESEEKKI